MDNQNLNGLNSNGDNNLNNTMEPTINTQTVNNDVEVLDDLDTSVNNVNTSFVKEPEVKVQNPNELLNSVPKPDMMVSSPNGNVVSTDELLEEYIGKNYEKITKRSFNLAALFLGPTYFLYRKMYLYGIILQLLLMASFIGLSLISIFIPLISSLVIALVSCLFANKIYVNFSKSNIEKIKKKNNDKSINDLSKICSKKGGTSLLIAIVISGVVSGALTSVITAFMPDIYEQIANKLVDDMNLNTDSNSNNDNIDIIEDSFENKFNGEINYKEDIVIDEKVSIGFLQTFTPTVLNSEYRLDYEYKSVPTDDSSKCVFEFGVVKNYNSANDLIKEMSEYYENSIVDKINSSKNLEWNNLTYEGNLTKVYYNAIENNNELYLLTYEIPEAANETVCKAFYNGILNSIEFK